MKKIPFKISDEEIVRIYLETKSLKKTALAAQGIIGTSTIKKKLIELGVEVKNHFLKPITVSNEELCQMYNSGMSLMSIAKKVSGSKGAMGVRKKLQELGIDTSYANNIHKYRERLSQANHTYTLDEHVFDTIDTEEKAYWLGFLMADGYNHEDRNAICFRLQTEDLEILEKFKVFLKSDAPICAFSRTTRVNKLQRTYSEIRVNSIHLSKQLAKLGCVQGKTYTLEYPTYISDNLMPHFIRGYFDGDGCICIKKRNDRKSPNSMSYQLTITGREEFILCLQKWLIKETGVTKTKLEAPANNFARVLHYGGRIAVFKILNYLYKDATIFLKRKHDKYIDMVVRQGNLQELINPVNSGNTLRA